MGARTILAVSDVVDDRLWATAGRLGAELVVSCGDLPNDYLEDLAVVTNAPLVWVPGNHDGVRPPRGAVNVDGRVETVLGVRFGGLGGCMRYRPGPNQYTERQMARRARRLVRRAVDRLDVFVAHAPPAGLGDDASDTAHRGFAAFYDVLERCRPALMLHGHVQVYGPRPAARRWGATAVVNVLPQRMLEVAA